MKEIKYSFIIPHKNRPDLLQRCVNSIPDRDDVQIIVVDDNSETAKKPCIVREGLEVVLLSSQQSKGAGHARNVGLEYAKGEWLLFADADDYYNDGFLNILDEYTKQKYDVIFFNFLYKEGKTGELLPKLRLQECFLNFDGSPSAIDEIKYYNKVPWSKMVSSRYVKMNNIHFEEVLNGNDIYFSICVGRYANKIAIEKAPLYVYLKNDNSIQTSKPTIKGALCEVEHSIKLNNLYDFLGHPEWKGPCAKMILSYMLKLGMPFFFSVLLRSITWFKVRNEWIDSFKKAKTELST